ncbi:MAG: tyrosine--tRNA ligase [Candidatus Paceibacterota bacterium]|jgi:tyrosyl-tRNA synthetase
MINIAQELTARGLIAQQTHEDKLGSVLTDEKLTFYAGFDPSADSLHIGSLALLMTMARLVEAGHSPICLVGGATGLIGDPSGKTEMRQMLTKKDVQRNFKALTRQIKKILAGRKIRFVNNFDWLKKFNYLEFLRGYGPLFKVNEMIKNETYRERLAQEHGLTFLEFNYLILQAVDYLHLFDKFGCRLQIGGSDQWGNILGGVELIRRERQVEAYAFTIPLITRSDGKKMGKSEAGAVWLDASKTSPFEFYQYWINVDDQDVGRFLKIFTFLSLAEIAEWEKLTGADIKKAKEVLAFEVTKFVHGEAEAKRAQRASRDLFGSRLADSEAIPSVEIEFPEVGHSIVDLLMLTEMSMSRTNASRLVNGGGVYVDDVPISNHLVRITKNGRDFILLRVGKKNYKKVVFK